MSEIAPSEVVLETPAEGTPAPNLTDPAPVASPGEDKPATDPPVKPAEKPSQSSFDRRIARKTREAAEHKARADYLEQKLNEATAKAPEEGTPRMEQFDDIEKYAQAKADFETARKLKEHETQQRTLTQRQAEQTLRTEWDAKVQRAESKYDDFDEVVGELQPTTAWAATIMRAENGEDIAHHLGKNIKDAQRIAALDPASQIYEIGRLSAKLEAKPTEVKTPSDAPAPIRPLLGSGSHSAKKLSEMSQDEFEKARRARIAARR